MQKLTQIKLYTRSLYPSAPVGGYLDCDDKTVVPLNFAISDIRDISKKKGTFSKSITIPGTKNNNKLLGNYFDVNVQAGTFNINKIQSCAIIQDGVVILDNAILQLVSINKSQSNGSYEENVTYTVLIKDTTSDFFTIISNKYLNDIDLSDLDHLYTSSNVIASFTNTIEDGYKYLMPYNPSVVDDVNFNLNEFVPGIYAKRYFDKIFANSGYHYSWPSLDDPEINFSKLIIPYNGDVVSATKEDSVLYNAKATRTGLTTTLQNNQTILSSFFFGGTFGGQSLVALADGLNTPISIPTEVSDPNGNYNPATSTYTAPNIPSVTNDIKFTYQVEFEINLINGSGAITYLKDFVSTGVSTSATRVLPRMTLNRNGAAIFTDTLSTYTINANSSYTSGTHALGTGTVTIENTSPGVTLGDLFTIGSYVDIVNTAGHASNFYTSNTITNPSTQRSNNVRFELKIKNITLDIQCQIDGEVGFNVPLRMNNFIPQKIKQSDFVKSICTMFNLYIDQDQEIPNRLNFISRDEYYDSGEIKDWTKKLVKDKAQDLKFIPEISNKKILLTYKQDEDWANATYKASTNEVYGQAEYEFENEYVKDTTTNELIFSPTPVANTVFGAICPMWNGQAPQTNIRILYDGGALPCGTYNIYNYDGATPVSSNSYPHLSHWDKPADPTFDLNFLPCDYYFRSDNWGSDTNNNLFNLHWRRTMNQINQGKILTAYFTLNANDIFDLKLNDKIRIDNSWWNINKIQDYDANGSGPTKVELISIDDQLAIPFRTRDTARLNIGSKIFGILNDLAVDRVPYVNTILSQGPIKVTGSGNFVGKDALNGTVLGSGNVITSDSIVLGDGNVVDSNAFVRGSGNIVPNGLQNVMVVGMNIQADDNGLWTDSITLPAGGTINGQDIATIVGPGAASSLWAGETGYIRSSLDKFRVYDSGATYMQPITTASVTTPVTGMIVFDSVSNSLVVWNGTKWVTATGAPRVKTYRALISSGTATVFENTLGTITVSSWGTASVSAGDTWSGLATVYRHQLTLNSASLYTSNKTFVSVTAIDSAQDVTPVSTILFNTSSIGLQFFYPIPGYNLNCMVEIIVYP